MYQFGTFGPGRIRAWTLATDTGFMVEDAPLKLRFGLKADIASGDGNLEDNTLGTFNPLNPKQPYFSEANLATAANIMDIHPSLEFELRPDLTLSVGVIFQWRHRNVDAIYLAELTEDEGSAGGSAQHIGTQMVADVEWKVAPTHVTHSLRAFRAGGAVREAGGSD